jgi:hypothetical protein
MTANHLMFQPIAIEDVNSHGRMMPRPPIRSNIGHDALTYVDAVD